MHVVYVLLEVGGGEGGFLVLVCGRWAAGFVAGGGASVGATVRPVVWGRGVVGFLVGLVGTLGESLILGIVWVRRGRRERRGR